MCGQNLSKKEVNGLLSNLGLKSSLSYFQHDMSYGDFQDLPRRTAPDKVLRDITFNITKNPKYDGYQR